MNDIAQRWEIFKNLAPYFGRVVPARLIQKTQEQLKGIPRIHSLNGGIYKPAGSSFALCIASMLKNPYADKITYNNDRSWQFWYSPKEGPLEHALNQSLFECMKLNEPLLVIKQLTDKFHQNGSTYKILGLGLIEEFDALSRLFKIRQLSVEQFQARVNPGAILDDEFIETALQLEALEAWAPFVEEERAIYKVAKIKRDAAFRKIVLENYEHSCAVLKTKFAYQSVVEAEAAHIIGKEVNGTDDPRNGLALSHTAHWAFDKGIFTISDQYEILVHPEARQADSKGFHLLKLDRQEMLLPSEKSNYPHPDALKWHREEVYGRFSKQD